VLVSDGLCHTGSAVVFATGLEDGSAADAPLAYPRIFDIYGVMHETSGAVKGFFVCCGHGTPLDLKRSSLATDKDLVLGLEFAMVAVGRAASAERTVEFRSKGKAIDSAKEPPIVAHALGDTKMRVRPVDGITELSAIIGSKAVNSLRTLLLRSEIYRVLVKDIELVESQHLLSMLDTFPKGVNLRGGKLGEAVLMQALGTTVMGLVAARGEQARTYTADKQTRALSMFAKTASELVQLAGKLPTLLHLTSPFNEAAQNKLLAKLVKMEPKLGTTSAPPAAPKGPDKRAKRLAADVASHNSPAGKKTGATNENAEERPPPLPNARMAALRMGGSDVSSDSPGSSISVTAFAQGQLESNSSKLVELAGKLQDAEVKVAQLTAELAEERRTTARLQGEVTAARVPAEENQTLLVTIAGLRAEITTKDASLNDLRHSQAMWSSMFMAKNEVAVDTFQALMNATTQAGKGAGSSGDTSEKK